MDESIKLIDHEDVLAELMKDPEYARWHWRGRPYVDLAKAIYEHRKRIGISQRDLGARVKIKANGIRALENSDALGVQLNTVVDIAEALGCRVVVSFEQIDYPR